LTSNPSNLIGGYQPQQKVANTWQECTP